MTQARDDQGANPAAAVKLPAILLMCVGGLYVLAGLLLLGGNVATVALSGKPVGKADSYTEAQLCYGVIGGALTMVFGAPVLSGAIMMKMRRSYFLAMAGAIRAMLPCSCCFIIGLPLGMWALVVLLKPEVKAGFQQSGAR